MTTFQHGEKPVYHENPKTSILIVWFFTRTLWISLVMGWALSLLLLPFIAISQIKSGAETKFSIFLGPFISGPEMLIWIIPFILVFIYHVFLIRTYEYYITNRRVIFKGGIVRKKMRSVPFRKITDVETSQNIIEQMLGISKLHIHTAGTGTAKAEIVFVGLEDSNIPERQISNALRRYENTSR